MAKYLMRAVRDARRERRCAKFCARFCQGSKKDEWGELDDLVEKEERDYSDSSSDDEGDAGQSGGRAAVKLSSRMKKLVTPSVVHGANYLLSFKPQPVVLKKKKPKKKGKRGPGDLEAIDEEGGDDGPGSPDGEGKEEMHDEDGDEGEDDEQQWDGDGEQPPNDALEEGDERRLDLSALGVSAASASDVDPPASQRSQRSARPLPPTLTADQAAALPKPEDVDPLLSSRPPGSGRSGGSSGKGGAQTNNEPVAPRPSVPPPQA
jgi:hypothetical protein